MWSFRSPSCLPPLLFWGGLIGFFLICRAIDAESPNVGKWIFGGGLIAGVVGIFIYMVAGRTLKETGNNLLGCVYVIFIVIAMGAFFSMFTKCSHEPTRSPDEIYFRK